MDLTEWVARLKANCPEFENRIFLLDELLLANPKELPTAFVLPRYLWLAAENSKS